MIQLFLHLPKDFPMKPSSTIQLDIRDEEDRAYTLHLTGTAWTKLLCGNGPVEASLITPEGAR
jgi:hypothetical protein